ncbi:MAG: OmpA family protein [Gemmatimonadaceae bacterium]
MVAPLLAACATRGALRRGLDQERIARETETTARIADIAAVKSDLQGVKTDIAALRTELQSMRTDFGAKISAVEDGVRFAFPVNFAFDDAAVREQDRAALDRFASVVQRYYGQSKLTVEGFADPAGTERYNRGLSLRRAESVREYLTAKGLPKEQLMTIGYGKARLVNPGAQKDDPGAEQNRRVVFVVETKGEKGVALNEASEGSLGERR